MIKSPILKWVIILVTGAVSYGASYGSSQYPDWAMVFGGVAGVVVVVCGKLTGFPPKES